MYIYIPIEHIDEHVTKPKCTQEITSLTPKNVEHKRSHSNANHIVVMRKIFYTLSEKRKLAGALQRRENTT